MKLKLFLLVLALQCAWLLGTTFQQERALATGKTILLETERVDPRDPLRGDYLILNYKISTVPTSLFSPPVKTNLPAGTKVFVAVRPGPDDFYVVNRASTSPFTPAADERLLRGQSNGRWWNQGSSIHVKYGLEKYFVAEGTGNPHGKLTVLAVVSASGRATIKEVFVDGKPYAEAMRDNHP